MKNHSGLLALAKLAPADIPPTRQPPSKLSKKKSQSNNTLGKLNIGEYLDHYGVGFNIKESGAKTLYRLNVCLFNSGHGKNDAAIVQDHTGLITYSCFHNGCDGKRWHDAKQSISGDEKLARFCDGYDPDWKPRVAPPAMAADDKKEKDFINYSKTGRAVINPARLANYLEDEFSPLLYEGADYGKAFYKYHKSGVWQFFSESAIRRKARELLGEVAKPIHIRDSLGLLQDQCYVEPEKIQPNPMIMNLKNGMYDLETGELSPHSPDYYSRVQMPVNYTEDYDIKPWLMALGQIFEDNPDKIDVLQDFFGYCLYPKIIFPAALFQIGGGGNGKGLVESVLCSMLGNNNVSHISLKRMEKDFGPIEIKDKLLNSCGETEAGQLDVTNFKAICAGDTIQAEVKFKGDVIFTPIAKQMISMNYFPGIKDKTNAFFRRVIVLEYKQVFEGKSDDQHLKGKLLDSLDAIFMWSLEGLRSCLKHGKITVPDEVAEAKVRFREKASPALLYINECCIQGPDYRVTPPELYKHYRGWCDDSGVKHPLGKHNFYEQVRLNCPDVTKRRPSYKPKEFFEGIGIKADDDN